MNKRDYRDLMIAILKMQMQEPETGSYLDEYQEGFNWGLRRAIMKLEQSEFILDS